RGRPRRTPARRQLRTAPLTCPSLSRALPGPRIRPHVPRHRDPCPRPAPRSGRSGASAGDGERVVFIADAPDGGVDLIGGQFLLPADHDRVLQHGRGRGHQRAHLPGLADTLLGGHDGGARLVLDASDDLAYRLGRGNGALGEPAHLPSSHWPGPVSRARASGSYERRRYAVADPLAGEADPLAGCCLAVVLSTSARGASGTESGFGTPLQEPCASSPSPSPSSMTIWPALSSPHRIFFVCMSSI